MKDSKKVESIKISNSEAIIKKEQYKFATPFEVTLDNVGDRNHADKLAAAIEVSRFKLATQSANVFVVPLSDSITGDDHDTAYPTLKLLETTLIESYDVLIKKIRLEEASYKNLTKSERKDINEEFERKYSFDLKEEFCETADYFLIGPDQHVQRTSLDPPFVIKEGVKIRIGGTIRICPRDVTVPEGYNKSLGELIFGEDEPGRFVYESFTVKPVTSNSSHAICQNRYDDEPK